MSTAAPPVSTGSAPWTSAPAGARSALSSGGWALAMAVAERRNTVRLLLMSVGVGLCAFVLAALATISPMVDSMNARAAASTPTVLGSGGSFQFGNVTLTVHGHVINGMLLDGTTGAAPKPPGTSKFPRDGELIVSPALAAMLADPAEFTLRDVLPGTVIGSVDPAGLPGTDDLFFYQGDAHLVGGTASDRWGVPVGEHPLDPRVWSLLITGTVIVLVPLLLFTALAGRLGSARRDRRTAILRLLGASSGRLRLLLAGEAGLAAVVGVLLAAAAYLIARLVVPTVRISGRGVQLHDVVPDTGVALGIMAGVPVLTVAAVLTGFRSTEVDPLTTMQRARRGPRASWRWGLAVLAAGIACWAGFNRNADGGNSEFAILAMCLVVAVSLFAVAGLVGLITDRIARFWPGGTVAGQLGRCRLRQDGSSTTRSAAALATVMAGFIVLMTLLAGSRYVSAQAETVTQTTFYGSVPSLGAAEWNRLDESLMDAPGVVTASVSSSLARSADGDHPQVEVATCTAIRATTTATRCGDGESFQVEAPGQPVLPSGPARLTTGNSAATRSWTPPANAIRVRQRQQLDVGPGEPGGSDYLLTPGAAAQQFPGLLEQQWVQVSVTMPASSVDAVQRAIAWLGPRGYGVLSVSPLTDQDASPVPWIRAGLVACGALTLVICALGQWLMSAEQISERRRSLALARASGVPLSVLGRSVVVAALLPLMVGVVLAAVAGAALAPFVEYLRGALWTQSTWQWVLIGAGAALAMGGLVAAGSVLSLRSATRPDALLTE